MVETRQMCKCALHRLLAAQLDSKTSTCEGSDMSASSTIDSNMQVQCNTGGVIIVMSAIGHQAT